MIEEEEEIKPIPKKQSHQIKALFYKTATLQWKQPCTNICQILTPIICLIFTALIRQVAIDNLSNDQNTIYNQIPMIPFKFNDFWLEQQVPFIFQRGCSQFFLVDWKNENDAQFIGRNDGQNASSGMLNQALKVIQGRCGVNQSFYPPFYDSYLTSPFFRRPHATIDQQIFKRYLYFNDLDFNSLRHTSAVQKMPDGGIFFNQANLNKLSANLQINDLRDFSLHDNNGITKIKIWDPFSSQQQDTYRTYYTINQGYLSLQDIVTHAYIKYTTNKQVVSGYAMMPPTSNSSAFIQTLINIIATIIFPLSLSLLLPVFLYNTVLQKQTKIIQMMRMNGLGIMTYWFVNFLFNFFISFVTNIVFFMFGYFYLQNTFFVESSFMVIWVVLIGWILCQIGMSMFLQVFISNSRAANIIGYLLTIWTNLIGATLSVALYQYPVQLPFFVGLWPTISFNRIFYLMFTNCSADHCINSFSAISSEMWQCILTIYIAAGIFILLGMYLFEVIPQQFGITKNILFPFDFLRQQKLFDFKDNEDLEQTIQSDDFVLKQRRQIVNMNRLDLPLICNGLTKVYGNGKKATSNFSLIIEDNQIFGLLGPNGAGKTTLLSMITGIFSPTKGTAYVSGYNIETQIDKVHLCMGVCPQFDILWQTLTVEDHLYFYARLRGTPRNLQDSKVTETIKEVSLENFRKFKIKQLSGGMKRRLSVAISLVGDPRIVFLDEPTTGLDPENRRNLWQLLAKCKQKRSLFLTTHLMEEAQSLCDKIGIITNGHLRTVGNQHQLKKIYGDGYSLTICVQMQREYSPVEVQSQQFSSQKQKNDQQYSSSEYQQSSSVLSSQIMLNDSVQGPILINKMIQKKQMDKVSKQKLDELKKQILELVPTAILVKQLNGTMKFNLGHEIKLSKTLSDLYNLKKQKQNINFEWSVNNSSLQDVFMNVVQIYPKQRKQIEGENEQYERHSINSQNRKEQL